MPNDIQEIRQQRKEKLQEYYIHQKFQSMLNSEINKHKSLFKNKTITFPIQNDRWKIITMQPICYAWYGYVEEYEQETIIHVLIKGYFHINGKPAGLETLIQWSVVNGFCDLKEYIIAALEKGKIIPKKYAEHSISNIMDEEFELVENEFNFIAKKLAETLAVMGLSNKKAHIIAEETIFENSEITDIDKLLDIAMSKT